MSGPARKPTLGERARDDATGIDGTLIARTAWHDRSDECCLLRDGTNHDGLPWDLHWFPASRLVAA